MSFVTLFLFLLTNDICRHIIQELQREIDAIMQQKKLVEAENKMLLTEIDKLREVSDNFRIMGILLMCLQEMRELEDNVEQSILREERELEIMERNGAPPSILKSTQADIKSKQDVSLKSHSEMTIINIWTAQAELEQLRKKLNEVEMKNARTIHDVRTLNKCAIAEV